MTADHIPHRNAEFAQQLVQRLCEAGCAGFVVSPGSRNTPIVMAAANTTTPIEVVVDERSAGFFALGWAKAAREPIALVCTSGSAGAHYLPAVIEARETWPTEMHKIYLHPTGADVLNDSLHEFIDRGALV